MHTRSARNKVDGTLYVRVFDWNGDLFSDGTFINMREADQFVAEQERKVSMLAQAKKVFSAEPLTLEELLMSDNELLARLTS